jgi:hypothetical protein
MSNLREIIKETLESHLNKSLILKENINISESLEYHINEGLSLTDNVFKVYSQKYFDLISIIQIQVFIFLKRHIIFSFVQFIML